MDHQASPSQTSPSGRRFTDSTRSATSLVASGARLEGNIKGTISLEVQGVVAGTCTIDGLLLIREAGRVKGDISATDVVVTGEVVGNISATRKIELGASSKVLGDIAAPSIAIEEGCHFEGSITMSGENQQREMITFRERRNNHTG